MALPNRGNKMSNDERIAVLETTIIHIHETLERIEKNMNQKFNELSSKIDKTNERIDKINDRLWSNFLWLISSMFALFAVMGHGFHWF